MITSTEMTASAYTTITHRLWTDVFGSGRLELVPAIAADPVDYHVGTTDFALTRQTFVSIVAAWRGSFPDLEAEVEVQVEQGNFVSDRVRFYGTHTGEPYRGRPPQGSRFEFTQQTIARFAGGLIVELWEDYDAGGFLAQLA